LRPSKDREKNFHMKALRHSAVVMAAVALAALTCPSLAGATSATAVSIRQVPAKGGIVTWKTTVKHTGWCVWSSTPKVPRFNVSVQCKAGTVSRSATVPKNPSTKSKDYTLTLKLVTPKSAAVQQLSVVEAGAVVKLGVHLDPSFTQNPGNPLEVTWYYSASANLQLGTSQQADPSLPAGVLELISNGLIIDTKNVGGSVTSAYATTTYPSFNGSPSLSVTIDVIYDSGTNSATTGNETYDIPDPNVTTTTESLSWTSATTFTATAITTNVAGTVVPQPSSIANFWITDATTQTEYTVTFNDADTNPTFSCQFVVAPDGADVTYSVISTGPSGCSLSNGSSLYQTPGEFTVPTTDVLSIASVHCGPEFSNSDFEPFPPVDQP
jgi:hypothetical protein